MNEILRYIIPPQVRKMAGEFKQQMQNLIDQHYKANEKSDVEERAFLGQYQLPNSYFELTSVSDIPEQYWQKIEEFQKKGAISNFTSALSSMSDLGKNCNMMIDESSGVLDKEEQEDGALRAANGPKWTLLASTALNQPYRQNLKSYRDKLQMAANQDTVTLQRFNDQKSELDILTKSKQELLTMMP